MDPIKVDIIQWLQTVVYPRMHKDDNVTVSSKFDHISGVKFAATFIRIHKTSVNIIEEYARTQLVDETLSEKAFSNFMERCIQRKTAELKKEECVGVSSLFLWMIGEVFPTYFAAKAEKKRKVDMMIQCDKPFAMTSKEGWHMANLSIEIARTKVASCYVILPMPFESAYVVNFVSECFDTQICNIVDTYRSITEIVRNAHSMDIKLSVKVDENVKISKTKECAYKIYCVTDAVMLTYELRTPIDLGHSTIVSLLEKITAIACDDELD
jgi:hypothetical protein